MPKPRPSVLKRQREQTKRERKAQKAEKKALRETSDIDDIENMKPFDGPRVPEGMEPMDPTKGRE